MDKMEFPCSRCPKKFTTKRRLNDHLFKIHKTASRKAANYSCGSCSKQFVRSDTALWHLLETHGSTKPMKCVYCDIVLENVKQLQNHVAEYHDIRKLASDPHSSKFSFFTKNMQLKNFSRLIE